MTVCLPRQFSDPWTNEQVLAGAEHLDLTQVMRLLHTHSSTWTSELMASFVEKTLPRLFAAHQVVPQDELLVSLWLGAYLANPPEGPATLERFCRGAQDIELMATMVGKIDCRQDVDLVSRALDLSRQWAPGDCRVRDWLMGSALRDAINRNKNGLLQRLLEEEGMATAKLSSGVYEGNALVLWVMCLPEMKWTPHSVRNSLDMLLAAGVDPNEEGWVMRAFVSNNASAEHGMRKWKSQYDSVLALLCSCINEESDERSAQVCALNCLLDAGIDWNGLDLGGDQAATLIRAHPRWISQQQKLALEAQVGVDRLTHPNAEARL